MEMCKSRKELKVHLINIKYFVSKHNYFFKLGIPRAIELNEAAFRSTLFEGTPFDVPVNSFFVNANREMTRIQCYKRGLSDSCTKVTVSSDKVSCSPLMKDGKFI